MSPRYRRNEGEQIKGDIHERLLNSAADEFARAGFEKASIDQITSSAGVAAGTFYNYFGSKTDMMMRLLEEIGHDHITYMAERIRSQQDPIERVRQLFIAGFEYVHLHPARARVLFTHIQGPLTPFKEKLNEIYQPLMPLIITDIILPGVQQGVFAELPPVETATMILTFYLGIGSIVDEQGNVPLDMDAIIAFALRALGVKL